MKVMVIIAFDHFSTERKEESKCLTLFIGEYLGEDKNYISLRHIKANINDENSAEEIHKVLKKVIVQSKELEFSDFNIKEKNNEGNKRE